MYITSHRHISADNNYSKGLRKSVKDSRQRHTKPYTHVHRPRSLRLPGSCHGHHGRRCPGNGAGGGRRPAWGRRCLLRLLLPCISNISNISNSTTQLVRYDRSIIMSFHVMFACSVPCLSCYTYTYGLPAYCPTQHGGFRDNRHTVICRDARDRRNERTILRTLLYDTER